jgi:hypothetical protein
MLRFFIFRKFETVIIEYLMLTGLIFWPSFLYLQISFAQLVSSSL